MSMRFTPRSMAVRLCCSIPSKPFSSTSGHDDLRVPLNHCQGRAQVVGDHLQQDFLLLLQGMQG